MYNTNPIQNQQPAYYQVNRPVYPAYGYAGLKGRPVATIEEVRGSIIDFDGSIFYFPDLANKRIYTKQINMDGTAILNVYELKELPASTMQEGQYITREEFEATIQQLRSSVVAPQSVPAPPVSRPVDSAVKLDF